MSNDLYIILWKKYSWHLEIKKKKLSVFAVGQFLIYYNLQIEVKKGRFY